MSTIGLAPQPSRPGPAGGNSGSVSTALLALAYTALAVYGSLVPFDFHPRPLAEAWAQFLGALAAPVGIQSRADWAANVLLFVPLAWLWCAAVWPRRRWARGAAGLAIWALAVVLSASIEFTQSFLPSRSVSLNDILAEGLGAALGVVAYALTGARLAAWLGAWRGAATVPGLAAPALVLYLVGLVLFGLMPFDLSLSPALLYQKFAAGRVRLGPLPRLDGPPLQALTDLLTDVAVWVPAGCLGRLALGTPPGARAGRASSAIAWLGCVVAAAGIEGLRLPLSALTCRSARANLAKPRSGRVFQSCLPIWCPRSQRSPGFGRTASLLAQLGLLLLVLRQVQVESPAFLRVAALAVAAPRPRVRGRSLGLAIGAGPEPNGLPNAVIAESFATALPAPALGIVRIPNGRRYVDEGGLARALGDPVASRVHSRAWEMQLNSVSRRRGWPGRSL